MKCVRERTRKKCMVNQELKGQKKKKREKITPMDSKFIKSNDVRVKKYFCMVRKVLCLPSPKNLKVMLIFSPPPSFYPTRFYFPYPNLGYVGRKKRRERNMQIYKLIKL